MTKETQKGSSDVNDGAHGSAHKSYNGTSFFLVFLVVCSLQALSTPELLERDARMQVIMKHEFKLIQTNADCKAARASLHTQQCTSFEYKDTAPEQDP